jgi:xylan 1,4-beta-xylosidase
MKTVFYNAHHSPIGAFASFSLGFPGAHGGLGLELGKPADSSVYIGLQSHDGSYYQALPFFQGAEKGGTDTSGDEERKRYDVENRDENGERRAYLASFRFDEISRDNKLGTDTWQAGDLTFRVYSPVRSVPDPATASDAEMKLAIVPTVIAEITVDNTQGEKSRRAFFGFTGTDAYNNMRRLDDTSELNGIAQVRRRRFRWSTFWLKRFPITGLLGWAIAVRCFLKRRPVK